MKMSRSIVSLLLCAVFVFFAFACNQGDPTAEPSADATEEQPTSEPTAFPTDKPEPTDKPTSKPEGEKGTEPPEKLEDTTGLDLSIKVMSQNIRCYEDPEGTVDQRKTRFEAMVKEHQPDIIGTQEVRYNCHLYLRLMKTYGLVGISRNGANETSGEWCAIMYRKERFVLMDSGTFWLTSTPEEVSMTEGANCRRICTWAELFDKYTGETVIMTNTHLDHANNAVRVEQTQYLIDHLKSYLGDRYDDCTVFLTGDFNCTNESDPYALLLENGFVDSHTVAEDDQSTVNGSYHAFENKDREIDFCFFKGDKQVTVYDIINEPYVAAGETEPGFVSDHYAVVAVFGAEE